MTAKTDLEREAILFVRNTPEIETYTPTDLYCCGAAAILTKLRTMVNDLALEEPKSGYEKGLHDGLIWSWEKIAELFVHDGDDLETLLNGKV